MKSIQSGDSHNASARSPLGRPAIHEVRWGGSPLFLAVAKEQDTGLSRPQVLGCVNFHPDWNPQKYTGQLRPKGGVCGFSQHLAWHHLRADQMDRVSRDLGFASMSSLPSP